MHTRFIGLALALCLLFFAGISPSISQPQHSYASFWSQEADTLQGKHIYFTESSREPTRFDRSANGISRFAGLLTYLGAELYTLEWRSGIPADTDLLVISGPISDLTPDQVARLWAYLNGGGKALIIADPDHTALLEERGLFQLTWTDMGVRVMTDVLMSEGVAAERDATPEGETTPTPPAEPGLITRFSTADYNPDHPIGDGLNEPVAFWTARGVEVQGSLQRVNAAPLLFSPPEFYGEGDYAAYVAEGRAAFDLQIDTAPGRIPLAAAVEHPGTGARLVLLGDLQVVTNGWGFTTSPGYSSGFVHPGNVRFMLHVVSWLLAAEPAEVTFPTPAPTGSPTVTPSPTLPPSPTPAVSTPGQ